MCVYVCVRVRVWYRNVNSDAAFVRVGL